MFGDLFISLLQVQFPERTDNFLGDTFSGFLGQIPTILIVWVCGTGLLLVGSIAYFVFRRRQRAARQLAAETPAAHDPLLDDDGLSVALPAAAMDRGLGTGELPDLDMLLDRSTLTIDPPQAAAPPPRSIEPDTFSITLNTGQITEAQEELVILRDSHDGRLIIQMQETAYRTLLDAPEAKKQFTRLMRELADVVTQPDERLVAAEETPVEPPLPFEDMPLSVDQKLPSPVEDLPSLGELMQPPAPPEKPKARSVAPPPVDTEGRMPGDLPTYKLEDNPVKVSKGFLGRQKFESDPVPELNIASAIEAYLQHKLRHTPEYALRQIHVHPSPGGGVRIQVDDSYYEAVSDVSDVEIRTFLSETIQEWQDRH